MTMTIEMHTLFMSRCVRLHVNYCNVDINQFWRFW